MNISDLLKNVNIDSNKSVFLITAKEAMENFKEAIEEYCPSLEINRMTKDEVVSNRERWCRRCIHFRSSCNISSQDLSITPDAAILLMQEVVTPK